MNNTQPFEPGDRPRRIAFYGGSFDPAHRGHLAVAHGLIDQFDLDRFIFLPALQAPHKKLNAPTSAYDRYAMLCLMTNEIETMSVSRMEIELPQRSFTFETLTRLLDQFSAHEIYFVMGADSWMDIATWFEWEQVLTMTNHIVITRPGFEISFDHVTDEIRERIVDLRNSRQHPTAVTDDLLKIFISDVVGVNISATAIRDKIRSGDETWRDDVTDQIANYIEKYQIYN